jgi:hypothetical protein
MMHNLFVDHEAVIQHMRPEMLVKQGRIGFCEGPDVFHFSNPDDCSESNFFFADIHFPS